MKQRHNGLRAQWDFIIHPSTFILYKCPADKSTVKMSRGVYPRVRSLSMSQAMNSPDD